MQLTFVNVHHIVSERHWRNPSRTHVALNNGLRLASLKNIDAQVTGTWTFRSEMKRSLKFIMAGISIRTGGLSYVTCTLISIFYLNSLLGSSFKITYLLQNVICIF